MDIVSNTEKKKYTGRKQKTIPLIVSFSVMFLLVGIVIGSNGVSYTEGVFWSRNGDTLVLTNITENVNIGENASTDYKLKVNGTSYFNDTMIVNGVITANGGDSGEWNDAYLWGDHSLLGYLTGWSDGDPFFNNSDAFHVTSEDMTNWNDSYSWGDHSLLGYITTWIDGDPFFNNSDAFHVTSGSMDNWNDSYSWGDHSLAGYLTGWTDGDPYFNESDAFHITSEDMDNWNESGDTYWTLDNSEIQLENTTHTVNISSNFSVTGKNYIPPYIPYIPEWDYYQLITIDSDYIDTDLTNFPVLVVIDDITADKCNGGDSIRFLDIDNTTEYYYEIEKWVDNEDRIVWVNITFISSSVDTEFFMFYGNSGASDNQNPTLVWDANYMMVQHMDGTQDTDIDDSTDNDNDVDIDGGDPTYEQSGKMGYAVDFDGTGDYLNIPDSNSLSFGDSSTDDSFTLSAWVYMNDATDFLFLSKGVTGAREYSFFVGNVDKVLFYCYDDTSTPNIGVTSNDNITGLENSWILLTATYDGSESENGLTIFRNDTVLSSTSGSAGSYTAMHNQAQPLHIGEIYGWGESDGLIDELRISRYERSISWIKANYHNQLPTEGFLVFDDEQTNTPIAGYNISIDLFTVDVINKEIIFSNSSVSFEDDVIFEDDIILDGNIISDSSIEWDDAYNHSQNNTQSHSDYMLNTGDIVVGNYKFVDGWFWTTGLTVVENLMDNTIGYSANVYVDPLDGLLYRSTSSEKYKKDIRDLELDTTQIYNITPKTFLYVGNSNNESDGTTHHGLIAEQVYEVLPDAVILDNKNKPDSIDWNVIIVSLLTEIQDLKDRITNLEKLLKEK